MVAVREFSIVTAIETAALAALEPYELEAVIPPNGIPELKVTHPPTHPPMCIGEADGSNALLCVRIGGWVGG